MKIEKTIYRKIYAVVSLIPPGQVATYGQIAAITGGCTARMVGYAMAALKDDSVPWHRVINSRGEVSPRSSGHGEIIQQKMLELEGVMFDSGGRLDLGVYRWLGPEKNAGTTPTHD